MTFPHFSMFCSKRFCSASQTQGQRLRKGWLTNETLQLFPLLCASPAGGVAPWALKYVKRWIAVSTCYHKMLPQPFTFRIYHSPSGSRFPVVVSSVPQCSSEMIQQLLKLRTLLLDASLDSSSPLWSGDLPSREIFLVSPVVEQQTQDFKMLKSLLPFFPPWLQEFFATQIASVKCKASIFKTSKLTFKDCIRSNMCILGHGASMFQFDGFSKCDRYHVRMVMKWARPHIHTFNDRLVSLVSVVLRYQPPGHPRSHHSHGDALVACPPPCSSLGHREWCPGDAGRWGPQLWWDGDGLPGGS